MDEIQKAKQIVVDDHNFNKTTTLTEHLLQTLGFGRNGDVWTVALASVQFGAVWVVTYDESKNEAIIHTFHQVDISTVYP